MDEARHRQWTIWNGWTPRQKLAAVGRMSASVLALHSAGLALRYGTSDPTRLRELRLAEMLRAAHG